MKLFLDVTKYEMSELLYGLKLYSDLMERQIKAIQLEQKERLGKEWDTYEAVFTEALPMNLRQSVIVTLISNIEWSLTYAVDLLKKRGVKLPRCKPGVSSNVHKIAFLNKQVSPAFSHPFEEKFLALAVLRNAIVHNAGKPEGRAVAVGPEDFIRLYDEKMKEAARKLHPAVDLGTSMWIEEGAVSMWTQEAHDWLAALYDSLKLRIGFEIPISK